MRYIVFDLEWNQCPNGKEHEEKALPFEILEIGAVKLDNERREIDRFSERIRPAVYKSLHFRTREILRFRMEMLKNARTFPEVFTDFIDWCGDDAVHCTWGPSDLYELQRNLSYYGMENPFHTPLRYYDIQKIFSIAYDDGTSRRSLERAADFLHIKKDLPFHSALNDALYTAEILKRIPDCTVMKNYSFDFYQNPKSRKDEIYAVFDTYSRFISREFASKRHAMRDWKVASTKCYICRKNARRKVRWFSSGNNNYYSLSRCEEHGWLMGKIHMRKTPDENFFCIKTLKLITDEEADEILARMEAHRAKSKAPQRPDS